MAYMTTGDFKSMGVCGFDGMDASDDVKSALTSQVGSLESLVSQVTDPQSSAGVVGQAGALRQQLSNYNPWSASAGNFLPFSSSFGAYDSSANLLARVDAATASTYSVLGGTVRGTVSDLTGARLVRDPVTGQMKGGAVTTMVTDTAGQLFNSLSDAAKNAYNQIPNTSTVLLVAGGFAILAIAVSGYAKGRGSSGR